MAPTLKREGDELHLSLTGLPGDEFRAAKSAAKNITGRRWDAPTKTWRYPATAAYAMKLVNTIRLRVEPDVLAMLQDHVDEIADELVSRAPDDAELTVPWADSLLPYQRAGAKWQVNHPHHICADDMGLGKTVQTITAVVEGGHLERPLVVAPNSVCLNWQNELLYGPRDRQRRPLFPDWQPMVSTVIDGRTPAKRREQLDAALSRPRDWVIVNWEKLRLMPELADVEWTANVADEAHRAKNRKAQQTKALYKLRAPFQAALTGTPILNSPDELWSPLHWLDPATYSSYWRFFGDYVEFYESWPKGRVITGVKNADALRFELADKLLRRTKTHVFGSNKLPTQTIEVALHADQRKMYEQAETELWLEVEAALNADPALAQRLVGADLRKISYLIPNAGAKTTRLRQIVSTPATLGGKDSSAKLDAAQEIILDHPEESFVVFTQYKPTTTALVDRLAKHKVEAGRLTGDESTVERDELVTKFQAGEVRVIVATTRAGGQGLTMTAAHRPIFVDRDWTPAYDRQGEDRLDRIGQDEKVQPIYLDAADTIDTEKIVPTNRIKDLIAGEVLGSHR